MNKKNGGYDVVFTFQDVSLKKLNEIHHVISSMLSGDNFDVQITDSIGGVHYIGLQKGEKPNGEKCESCVLIDCRECSKYST